MVKLEDYTLTQLRKLISGYNKKVKFSGYSKLKKDELIKMIRNHPSLKVSEGDKGIKIKVVGDYDNIFEVKKKKERKSKPKPEAPKPKPKKEAPKPKPNEMNINKFLKTKPSNKKLLEFLEKKQRKEDKDFSDAFLISFLDNNERETIIMYLEKNGEKKFVKEWEDGRKIEKEMLEIKLYKKYFKPEAPKKEEKAKPKKKEAPKPKPKKEAPKPKPEEPKPKNNEEEQEKQTKNFESRVSEFRNKIKDFGKVNKSLMEKVIESSTYPDTKEYMLSSNNSVGERLRKKKPKDLKILNLLVRRNQTYSNFNTQGLISLLKEKGIYEEETQKEEPQKEEDIYNAIMNGYKNEIKKHSKENLTKRFKGKSQEQKKKEVVKLNDELRDGGLRIKKLTEKLTEKDLKAMGEKKIKTMMSQKKKYEKYFQGIMPFLGDLFHSKN